MEILWRLLLRYWNKTNHTYDLGVDSGSKILSLY